MWVERGGMGKAFLKHFTSQPRGQCLTCQLSADRHTPSPLVTANVLSLSLTSLYIFHSLLFVLYLLKSYRVVYSSPHKILGLLGSWEKLLSLKVRDAVNQNFTSECFLEQKRRLFDSRWLCLTECVA